MPTITLLQRQRRRTNRINVHLDGEYAFSLALEVAAPLRTGQVLDDAAIDLLRLDDAYRTGLDRALRFLAYRPRSRAEVARYLRRRDAADVVANRVLDRLEELDLLDDAAFARWWVDNRTTHRPRGRRALRHELAAHGVDPAAIAAALAGVDDDELALAVALDKAPGYAGLPRPVFERRLGGLLARRGFMGSAAHAALRAAWRATEAGTAAD